MKLATPAKRKLADKTFESEFVDASTLFVARDAHLKNFYKLPASTE